MSVIEFIGFIISLLAMVFLFFRRAYEEHQRRKNPEQYELEEIDQDARLKDFLRSLDIDVEEEPEPKQVYIAPPPQEPVRRVEAVQKKEAAPLKKAKPRPSLTSNDPYALEVEEYEFGSQIEKRTLKSSLENRKVHSNLSTRLPSYYGKDAYEITSDEHPSRIRQLVDSLPSKRDLLLMQIIFDKPKGFKRDEFDQ